MKAASRSTRRQKQKSKPSPEDLPNTREANTSPLKPSTMNWTLLVTKSAKKSLAKLPDKDQRHIQQALDAMEADPYSGDIKQLEPPSWRRRVGNYRIFYALFLDEKQVV